MGSSPHEIAGLVAVAEQRAASSDPLDRLRAAVEVVDEVTEASQAALDRFVFDARRAKRSWAEIGMVLGVSRQAAQQRFASPRGDGEAWPRNASDTVRAVFVVAQDEARQLGHNYLGTEHVLLGLLAQAEGMAAHVLSDLEVSGEPVRDRIVEMVGRGQERRWDSLGVEPKVKRALEAASHEARRLGHGCTNTEHLLLGLCRSNDSSAVQILRYLGAPPERVVERVAEALGIEAGELRAPARRRHRLLRARR